MKMVKSLLLGSAATLIAVAGAQAADLPVKAKAVEYVKVCSLYGAGFYYIPGTDTCIKIGGFVRVDYLWNGNGSVSPDIQGANGRYTRADTADTQTRGRVMSSWDVRTQTEYGTLRSFARWGMQGTSGGGTAGTSSAGTLNATHTSDFVIDRIMIQFAGFTFGRAQSFADFSAPHGNGTYGFFSDTGGGAPQVLAYTAQLGNGLALTVAAEDGSFRRTPLIDADAVAAQTVSIIGAGQVSNYMGQNIPDFVASLRLDQAWGSAQISGAIHQVAAAYYGATDNTSTAVALGTKPGDKWGWNIGGGLSLNVPTGPGDQLTLEGRYSEGATHYSGGNFVSGGMYGNGGAAGTLGTLGLGYASDGVFAANTTAINAAFGGGTHDGSIELTTSWSAYASFQHFWTPALRSSIFGGIFAVDYGGRANALLCSTMEASAAAAFSNISGCDFDYKVYQVGTRTIWSPVANLDLSIDVFYSKLDQQHVSNLTVTAQGARPAGVYTLEDQDTWTVLFRAQRNFWY